MAKLDKRLKYQNEDEKPVTISMRLPKELHIRLEQYAAQHRQSISELVRDGLEWRLEEGDPRGLGAASTQDDEAYYISNTTKTLADICQALARQEAHLQALVQALERQAPGGSNGLVAGNTARESENPVLPAAPVPGGNDGQIETIAATPENNFYEQVEMVPSVTENGSEQIETVPTPAENIARQIDIVPDQSETVPAYDTSKHKLSGLCSRGHDYHGTGQSLRKKSNGACLACEAEGAATRRPAMRQQEGQP
jgi:predicted DNA-binding protein